MLGAVVTVLTSIQTKNGQWTTDMWEHVAVVRALINDPYHATRTLTLLDTPYSVTLGLLGSLLGTSAITILSFAAVANVVLFLVAFRCFVLAATRNVCAPFWALVFLLVLWGPSPYRFSGFFNLNSIGFVLPYPSTFATAIALLVLVAALRGSRDGWTWFIAVAAGSATVVLVHPITGLWLAVALLAVAVSRGRDVRTWLWLSGAGALAVILTLAWPYFRVFDLLQETNADVANRQMYQGVLLRIVPVAAVGLWAMWQRIRVDRRDVLGLILIGGLAMYAYGLLRGEYTYGRGLALVVIVLDVAAGDRVAHIEEHFRWTRSTAWMRAGALTLAGLVVIGLITTRGGLVRMVPGPLLPSSVRSSKPLRRVDDEYGFLTRFAHRDDVVIGTTKQDNRVIPAIAGQPLTPFWQAPAPSNASARAEAQAEFLDPGTSSVRRATIQAHYKIRFVLLHPRSPGASSLSRTLQADRARLVYEDGGFALLDLPASH